MALVALLFSVALTDVITNILKNFTGRLRPDFLARCNPFINASGQAVCQQTKLSFVWEGRKSFPSGHASTSFAGLGLLSWFILGFTRTFNGMGYSGKFFMAILPLILASIVAISRVNDNRHHVEDVLFGSALGIVISWFVYRLYFPFPGKLSNGEPHMERFEEIKTKVLNAQSALDSSI